MSQQSQSPSQGMRSGPGTPIIIDVHAEPGPNGPQFDHQWRFQDHPAPKKGAIEVPDTNGATPMHFHLRDNTGSNLRFVPEASEAMWVSRGQCPDAPSTDPQIEYRNAAAPKLLRVDNLNSEECTLRFALRFDSDQGPQIYDPEIKNGVKVTF